MSAAAQHDGIWGTDYRMPELLVAGFVALSVPVWSIVLLGLSNLAIHANAPDITAGEAVPIKVQPVVDLDSPLLKLGGGKKVKFKLPDMWEQPELPPQAVRKQKSQVSTNSKDDPDAIPDEDLELSDAGTAIAEDASVVKDTDVDIEDSPDAGEVPEGEGNPAGSKDGTEVDPLKARAANQYHSRISAFLRAGFSCPTGLTDEEKQCRATGSVVVSGGTVSAFSFSACGNPKIDGPAQSTISSKVGQPLPPPPENYPDLAPSNFTVTYSCR